MIAKTSEPSFTVRDEYMRVPARDGVGLHARLWRPVTDEPLPVVVNLDPYRSSDMRTLGRGDIFHWLARHGYVVAHVSARGTDASEGIAEDEYSPNEQRDGYDAVEWFGSQSWCNGNVAAIGTSYSAFTAIQIAAQQPPHLKAIVPICGTDDRYTDDVHYHGGLLHVGDNVMTYGVSMLAVNALPTLPEHGGIDWLDAWTARLEGTPFWLPIWMEHQRDGAYWRSGSLAPSWERIRAAALICGGWHDAYRNAGMRMLAKLTGPKRAIMGPWTHGYPDFNAVGPSGDFSGEMIAWLDRWLKGIENGVQREPVLLAYMQEPASPQVQGANRPGFWRSEPAYPVPGASEVTLHLARDGGLAERPDGPGADRFEYRATLGTGTLGWGGCPWLGPAADQRPDESLSLVYTSAPLETSLHVLGNPRIEVSVRSSAPVIALACKLADVAPDGSSALVTNGILNLTRRHSHARPEALAAGRTYEVTVELDATGYVFRPGHAIRIALSGSDYPNSWPTPYPATVEVERGGRLLLPAAPPCEADPSVSLGPPKLPRGRYPQQSGPGRISVVRDAVTGAVTVETSAEQSARLSGTYRYRSTRHERITANDATPAIASCESKISHHMELPGQHIGASASSLVTSTADAFHLAIDLEVTMNGRRHFARSVRRSYARDLL
jgi:uncharacterized protein